MYRNLVEIPARRFSGERIDERRVSRKDVFFLNDAGAGESQQIAIRLHSRAREVRQRLSGSKGNHKSVAIHSAEDRLEVQSALVSRPAQHRPSRIARTADSAGTTNQLLWPAANRVSDQ